MLLVSGGMDTTLRFFDIQQKTRIKQLNLTNPVTSLDFFTDGFTIALGDIEGKIDTKHRMCDFNRSQTELESSAAL